MSTALQAAEPTAAQRPPRILVVDDERSMRELLAIVHRIVSDYHGEIRVSSNAGKGTTVSVRLPARAAVATS